jgi:hypothetical protein
MAQANNTNEDSFEVPVGCGVALLAPHPDVGESDHQ